MRYVSYHDIVLYSKGGDVLYRFENGELDLGANKTIDATAKTPDSNTLMRLYETDIEGKKESDSGVKLIELCGQGDLTKLNDTDQGLRLFYEADPVDVAGITLKGYFYKVTEGSVVKNGKTYTVGDIFLYANNDTVTPSTGAKAALVLQVPKEAFVDLDGEFWNKHLLYGDEPKNYFSYKYPSGFEPRNSLLSTDINTSGFGYIR